MNRKNTDPPKTISLAPNAISPNSQRRRPKSNSILPPKKEITPVTHETMVDYFSDDKKAERFVKGMGIKKIAINRKTNAIEFELEEDFHNVLNTISSWKKISPDVYLSQLITEYFLSMKEKK